VPDFQIRAGDRLPAISATVTDGRPTLTSPQGSPVDLSGASVRFVMVALDSGTLAVDAKATVVDAAAGTVRYDWAEGDTDAAGAYLGEWQITFADGRRLTVPNGDAIDIMAVPGVSSLPPISSGDLAAIRSQIGSSVPPSNAELALALERLGSPDAVALQILRGRYAGLLASPAKWAVEGDFSVDNTANLKALAAAIDELSSRGGASALAAGSLTRSDRWR